MLNTTTLSVTLRRYGLVALRVFKTRTFSSFARRNRIGDGVLVEAVRRAERGLVQAELGGGLIKQRIARPGQGRSGGYRTIVAFRRGDLAIFLYGFAKSERANINADELATLKELCAALLAADGGTIDGLVLNGGAEEVPYG